VFLRTSSTASRRKGGPVEVSNPPVVALALDDATLNRLVHLVASGVQELLASDQTDSWMTPEEAADYIRAPVSRIYDLTARRSLRYVKDGRRTLIRRSWIDAYLEETA
jgi:excisionase family DNA binding protein